MDSQNCRTASLDRVCADGWYKNVGKASGPGGTVTGQVIKHVYGGFTGVSLSSSYKRVYQEI